ncbi:hypothetical protein C8R47DRAFT_1230103 [Mycena vitilis]|nr:hypothetical protein C8R47DRAFT_1230103 [Mycena vitilis]
MSPHPPLEILKKGLAALKQSVKKRRDDLVARLKREEKVSPADEAWLDTAGNQADEDFIIRVLDDASDYDLAFTRLDADQIGLVEKLKALGKEEEGGEGSTSAASNKRKRPAVRKKPTKDTTKQPAAPTFTKKENATLAQRIEILDWHHAQPKPNQCLTAEHFDACYPNLCLKQPTVSSWLKDEAMWRGRWAEARANGKAGGTKRLKQVEHPEIEKMMELWIAKAMRDRVHL